MPKNLFLQTPAAGDIEEIFKQGAEELSRLSLPEFPGETKQKATKTATAPSAPRSGSAPTAEDIIRRAIELGIDPAVPLAIFGVESGANFNSKDSPKGAVGGMQVMPGTYRMMMGTDEGMRDPWNNMEAALRYIAYGQKRLGTKDPALLTAGYHAGYDREDLKRGVIPGTHDGIMSTRDYAAKVAGKVSKTGLGAQPVAAAGEFEELSPEEVRRLGLDQGNDRFEELSPQEADAFLKGPQHRMSLQERAAAAENLKRRYESLPKLDPNLAQALEREAVEIDALSKQIEAERAGIVTPEQAAAFNKKVEALNARAAAFRAKAEPFQRQAQAYNAALAQIQADAKALDMDAFKPVRDRTWGEAGKDTAAQLAEGVNNILGAIPSLIAPESRVAGFFRDNADYWRQRQSDPLLQKAMDADKAIEAAGQDGVLAQIAEAAGQYFTDPALAARFITTNLPSMIPGIAATKVAQAAALARGASAARAAGVATTVGGATNAALNAGGARGEAFEEIKNLLIKQGLSPEEAEQRAIADSRVVAAVGAVTGFLSGKTGLERAIAGGPGAAGGAVRRGLGAAAKEFAGEQVEEVAPKVATNVQAGQYDGRDATQDVGRTMVETAIGAGPGTVVAGGAAALSRPEAAQPQPPAPAQPPAAPAQPATSPAPAQPTGPIGRALQKATGAAEPQAATDAVELPRVRITDANGQAITGFAEQIGPDGSGRVIGDDGQVYQFTAQDGVTIEPIDQPAAQAPAAPAQAAQPEPAEPAIAAVPEPVEVPVAEEAPPPAAPSVEPAAVKVEPQEVAKPAKAADRPLTELTDQELREHLRYLTSQAKMNGGWNSTMVAERRKVSAEIDRRNAQGKESADADVRVRDDGAARAEGAEAQRAGQSGRRPADAQPVDERIAQPAGAAVPAAGNAVPGADQAADAQPALTDPAAGRWFGSREKAEAFIAKKGLAASHEVVQTGKVRFEVKPKAPQAAAGDGPAATDGNVRPAPAAPIAEAVQKRNERMAAAEQPAGDRTPEWSAEMEATAARLEEIGRPLQAATIRKQIAKADDFPARVLLETARATLAKFESAPSNAAAAAPAQPAADSATTDAQPADVSAAAPAQQAEPTPLEKRNVWIPKMTPRRLDALLAKPERTADDIEDLKDFRYFLLTDQQSAIEKGFYEQYLATGGSVPVLKNKFWLTNINAAIAEGPSQKVAPPPAPEQVPAEASRPADDGVAQWNALTPAGRRAAMKAAGVKLPDAVMWEHISDANKQKLRPVVSNMLEHAAEPQAATSPAPAPAATQADAPKTEAAPEAKPADSLFAGNKLFTADKVAAAPTSASERYNALVKRWNDLVSSYQAADDQGKAAIKQAMDLLDAEMKAARGDILLDGKRQAAEAQARARDQLQQELAAMPVGARMRPSEFGADAGIFWEKTGDNEWTARGDWFQKGQTRTNAELAERGGLVEMPAAAAPSSDDNVGTKPKQEQADPFAGNKLFTSDKVAAARERLRKKLSGSQINSGIDPELLMDGMTIAGAYIESGVRNFTQYAARMVQDMGDGVKPYLLSFWEAARNYPGLDTEGMTSVEESKRLHAELLTPEVKAAAAEAIGEIKAKPAKRTKKTGSKADMTLTQDWGVDHINGYGDANRETGNTTKDAFLAEARNYLRAVEAILAEQGYSPQPDRDGRPRKGVSVNEGGAAGSGEVSLAVFNPEVGAGVYVHIGDTSLRGVVPVTPSGIAVMFRATKEGDPYGALGPNRWAPTDLSAADLAVMVDQEVRRVAASKASPKIDAQEQAHDDGQATAGAAGDGAQGQGAGRAQPDAGVRDAERLPVESDRADTGGDQRGAAGRDHRPGERGEPDVRAGSARPDAGDQHGDEGGRGDRAGAGDRDDRGPVSRVGDNYRIQPGELKRTGSWRATAEQNVRIVELVKQLEREGRRPTPEEASLLTKFTGWGATEIANGIFPDRYGRYKDATWQALGERLKAALTPEEYAQARRTTQYAHYTSEGVIRSIYDGLRRLGFAGGLVLEPGMGIGLFNGLMPADMAASSQYTGIEYDSITGAIAKLLYPQSNVIVGDYTKTALPREFFDAAIGNPPFGSIAITNDPEYKKHGFMLHDYFFAKTIDRVKPGGLVVFVTSKGTMDKANDRARKYLAERADLLGAVRLPQTAFKDNAGTEVVTDVLFLRKRMPGEKVRRSSAGAALYRTNERGEAVGQPVMEVNDWLGLAEVQTPQGPATINEYFAAHPEMVLGAHSLTGSMYRANEYTVVPEPGVDLEQAFARAVANLPEGVYRPGAKNPVAAAAVARERDFNPTHKKEGGLYVAEDGRLMQVESGTGVEMTHRRGADGKLIALKPNDKAFLKSWVGLRDALKQAQLDQLTDGDWEKSLKALAAAYDAFVAKHGNLLAYTTIERENEDGTVTVTKRFKNDPLLRLDVDGALAYSLEHIKETGEIVKAPVLSQRVLQKRREPEIKTTQDALFVSLNALGRLDLDDVARRAGMSRQEVIDALGTAIYEAPGEGWQTADEYLSGNVVRKLKEAQAAARTDKRYQRNVEALLAVQPKPLGPTEITVKLGQNWIPPSDIEAFAREALNEDIQVSYNPRLGAWSAEQNGSNYSEFNTPKMSAGAILDAVLNNRTIRVTYRDNEGKTHVDAEATEKANDVARKMREAFSRWIWTDTKRADRLVNYYNEHFNNIAPRQFDGSHLTLPGVSLRFNLYPHQKRAVWRIIQEGDTYLAHSVGSGKTIEMIASAMEQRRLGLIKKPIMVVPNHMLAQFAREFLELYPAANIMVADEQNFHTHNRRRFVAQAALNDPDAIIITHSAFSRIGMSDEFAERFIADQIEEWKRSLDETDQSDRITRKQIERRIEQLERRLEARQNRDKKDAVVTFEELGADFIYVDECFTYDTLVETDLGLLPIGRIVEEKLQARVKSLNPETHAIEWKPITNWYRHARKTRLIEVFHENGSFICTPNHNIWTDAGYVKAGYLKPGAELRVLRSGIYSELHREAREEGAVLFGGMPGGGDNREQDLPGVRRRLLVPNEGGGERREADLLFDALRAEGKGEAPGVHGGVEGQNEADVAEPADQRPEEPGFGGADAPEQSDEISADAQEGFGITEGAGAQAGFARREWVAYGAAGAAGEQDWVDYRVRGDDSAPARGDVWAAEFVQGGPGLPRVEVGGGDRRQFAPHVGGERAGRQEGQGPDVTRVVRVEVLEQGCDGEYRFCGRDHQFVYDIEVEGNHNYFANGVLVSNSHEFRKLDFATNQGNIKGIDTAGSQRAMDLFMKVQYLRSKKPGRALVMASGTPITNTMGELFTVQRFFQPDQLAEDGMDTFDAWANQYGDVVAGFEQNAAGGYEVVSRFAKFQNVPELMRRVRSFMDILTSSSLGELVQRPAVKGGGREIVVTPEPDGYRAYQKELEARINRIRQRKRPPKKGDDIILNVIADGRFSAIDMRFVDPSLPPDPKSKLNQALDDLIAAYFETKDYEYTTNGQVDPIKGSSLILFTDIGLGEQSAKSRGFDMKAWIEKRLTDAGIPREHIAFMRDYKEHAKKERLFADMREGKKRILIGGKDMETGVNVQKRLTHLFHLDAPWFPASVEQREGRIVRQGNQNKEVVIRAYATKGSYDSTMWGMNGRKARFIEQALNGDDSVRSLEDVSEASAFEMAAALASGDERYLKLAGLKADVERLERLAHAHHDDQNKLRRDKHWAEASIEHNLKLVAELKEAVAKRTTIRAGEFAGKVGRVTYDKRDEFSNALFGRFKALTATETRGEETIGEIGGFPITFYGGFTQGSGNYYATVEVGVPGDPEPLLSWPLDPQLAVGGLATRAANQVNALDRQLAEAEDRVRTNERRIEQIDQRLGAPFPEQAELLEKMAEMQALEAELTAEKAAEGGEPVSADAAAATVEVEGSQKPEAPKFSVATSTAPRTSADLVAELRQSPLGGIIDQLLANNRVVLHDTVREIGPNVPAGVQGFTESDGAIHLVAEHLRPGTASSVLLHEAFHGGAQSLLGDAQWQRLNRRLGAIYWQAQRSEGKLNEFWRQAHGRVEHAKRMVDRMSETIAIEEFGAYAIENYERAPRTLKKWVDDLIGAIKAWLVRRFGIQVGEVTPAQLRALAAAALRASAERPAVNTPRRPLGGVALNAYPLSVADIPETIEVDGVQRPSVVGAPAHAVYEEGTPQWAYAAYRSGVVPEGWYVHGRAGRQDLNTGGVVQLTQDWNVADSYSRLPGSSKWLIRPKPGAYTLDLSDQNTPDMDRVVAAALRDFERGTLPWLDDLESSLGRDADADDVEIAVREEFAPENIVDSARAYDSQSMTDWFADWFDYPSFVKTPDGAVVFSREGIEAVKVPEFMPDAYTLEQGPRSELPGTIEVDGVQRPTRNSNGQLIHPTEEGIRNFWRWFGSSRVVDEQGRPLVVYHGTTAPEDFAEFRTGSDTWHSGAHFGSLAQAEQVVAESQRVRRKYGKDILPERYLPVYLQMVNPKRVVDAFDEAGWNKQIAQAKAEGYDGIVYNNDFEGGGDSYIAFRPEQIKSAIGNRGTFDSSSPDIRFSIAPEDADKALDAAAKALDAEPPVPRDDYVGRVVSDLSLGARLIVHQRTIAAIFKEFTPVYNTAISQIETRDRHIAELGRGADAYTKLPQESKERVNKVLELGRLTAKTYTEQDLADGVSNPGHKVTVVVGEDGKPRPVREPIKALLTEVGEVVRLTEAEIKAYLGLRGMFDQALDNFRDQTLAEFGFEDLAGQPDAAKAIRGRITKDMDDAERERLENIANFISEIEQAKRTGYVPFARYGDYVVTVKEKVADLEFVEDDAEHLIVKGVPAAFAGDLAALGATEAKQEGGWRIKKSQRRDVERLAEKTVYSAKVETGLADLLKGRKAGKVDELPAVKAAIEQARKEWVEGHPNRRIVAFRANQKQPDEAVRLSDVDALAEVANIDNATWDAVRDKLATAIQARSFRKHFFHSDNVPGYTGDFERAIADYVIGMSGYLARREHQKRWDNALDAIPGDMPKLHQYASRYRDYVNSPQEEFAMVRQVGFFSYIAGVAATAFANLTQVPFLTVPTLAQVAPVPLVLKEVGRAYKDAIKMLSRKGGLDLFDPNKAPDDVRAAVKEAWDEGAFVPLETFDLMMTARQRNVGRRRLVKGFNDTTKVVSLFFTFAERLNRLVTFIAAARLSEKRAVRENARRVLGRDALARSTILRDWTAKNFAEWAVDESQYRMGKANRPTAMRGVGAAIMQFKGFMLQTFEAWYRMAALHGKEGKFAAASSLVMLYAMTGVWGLPGAEDLRKLIEAAYKALTDRDLDLKTELRAWVARTSGSNVLAQAITKGASYPLGVDMTRVGMGTVFPDSPLAAAGIPFDMLIGRPKRAFEKASAGDHFGAAGELSPNFLKHWLVAGGWATGGVRDKKGDLILPADQLETGDLVMKGLGFQPSIVTDVRDYNYAQYRQETAVDGLKRRFTARIARTLVEMERAGEAGDTKKLEALEAELAGIYDELAEYNESAPPEHQIQLGRRAIANRMMREREGVMVRWGKERRAARGAAEELRGVFGLSLESAAE